MPTKHDPIRCFEGDAQPYAPFWTWTLRNETDAQSVPELEFYGLISEYSWLGDEVTPKKFREDLQNNGKGGPITIRIHSGGGEIFAASAIASTLADYPGKKTVIIDGLAASAAVMVALAGDSIRIHDNAYMMVHNPSYSLLFGNLDSDTLVELAGKLEVARQGMLDAYANRTGLPADELSAMLDAETWMTAEQAVEYGFADRVIKSGKKPKKKASALDEKALKNYVNVPSALLNQSSDEQPQAADSESPITKGDESPENGDAELEAQAQRLRERVKNILSGK